MRSPGRYLPSRKCREQFTSQASSRQVWPVSLASGSPRFWGFLKSGGFWEEPSPYTPSEAGITPMGCLHSSHQTQHTHTHTHTHTHSHGPCSDPGQSQGVIKEKGLGLLPVSCSRAVDQEAQFPPGVPDPLDQRKLTRGWTRNPSQALLGPPLQLGCENQQQFPALTPQGGFLLWGEGRAGPRGRAGGGLGWSAHPLVLSAGDMLSTLPSLPALQMRQWGF